VLLGWHKLWVSNGKARHNTLVSFTWWITGSMDEDGNKDEQGDTVIVLTDTDVLAFPLNNHDSDQGSCLIL
jgi:hypothetical protein